MPMGTPCTHTAGLRGDQDEQPGGCGGARDADPTVRHGDGAGDPGHLKHRRASPTRRGELRTRSRGPVVSSTVQSSNHPSCTAPNVASRVVGRSHPFPLFLFSPSTRPVCRLLELCCCGASCGACQHVAWGLTSQPSSPSPAASHRACLISALLLSDRLGHSTAKEQYGCVNLQQLRHHLGPISHVFRSP